MDVGRVFYTPWCDEEGYVIDDGTVARLAETRFRLTSAEPTLRWLTQNARGFDVDGRGHVGGDGGARAAGAALGATCCARAPTADIERLRYFRVTSGTIAGVPVEISRTGYTGDLGYEIWVDASAALAVWDALMEAGQAVDIKPAGMLALDVARVEAGLLLADVDLRRQPEGADRRRRSTRRTRWGSGGWWICRKGAFIGKAPLAAERVRGSAPEDRWPGGGLDRGGGALRAMRAAAGRAGGGVASRRSRDERRSAGRPRDDHGVVADAEAAHRAGHDGRAALRDRHDAADGSDRRRARATLCGPTVVPTPFFNPPRKTATPPQFQVGRIRAMNSRTLTPADYALFRIVFGYVFLIFGLQKMFGWFGGPGRRRSCRCRVRPEWSKRSAAC